MIKAGELNRQITFRRKTETGKDSYNNPIYDWADAATVWASIITTGGKEFYAAQKLNAETSAVFKVRYTTVVNGLMQIKYGTRTFEIIGINDVNARREELLISAKEVV